MYLVLFETSGNQSYIFSTNKLRDNVGASELTARATSTWVLDALRQHGPTLRTGSSKEIREDIANPLKNVPMHLPNSCGFEVILATSGKAALLVRDQDDARALIRDVSTRAIMEAPGLTLTGVFVPVQTGRLHEAFSTAGFELGRTRWRLPGVAQRFPRLPILVNCSITGLPAERYYENPKETGEDGPRSAASRLKREAVEGSKVRLNQILPDDQHFARNMNEIEAAVADLDWLAVIHADGNGLGAIFQNFARYAGVLEQPLADRDRDYITKLRSFSMALEESTEAAFRSALEVIPQIKRGRRTKVLMLPMILGGDDLTVQCEGQFAVPFARAFLRAFEQETGSERYGGIIPTIAQQALKRPHLTSCAGVAVVKPHFPFFAAYDLAEALLTSAKQVKKRLPEGLASALDFHVLYDSSHVGLEDVRQRLNVAVTRLYAKPYVVTEQSRLTEEHPWWKPRHIDDLERRVEILLAPDDDGRRRLPQSQMHFLREGLFISHEEANARLRLLLHRYRKAGLVDLLPNPEIESLFLEEEDSTSGSARLTPFLDAMEAVGFFETREAKNIALTKPSADQGEAHAN